MIALIRLILAGAVVSLLAWIPLLIDWSASGMPPWDAEGPALCVALLACPTASLAILVGAVAMRRIVWLLDKLGLEQQQDVLVAEAEERGEAPA